MMNPFRTPLALASVNALLAVAIAACSGTAGGDSPAPEPTASLPDLIVSALSAPSTAQPGQSFVVSSSIKNQDEGSASYVKVAFYLTNSASSVTGATLLYSQNYGFFAAGDRLDLTTTLSVPSSTSPGTFYVVAVVDPSNATQESNETNNTRASGAIAVPSSTPPPSTPPPVSLTGPVYYVATTGSDNSSCGASTAPCATINYAYANKATAGATILVQPGTYSSGGRAGWGVVVLNKSGTATAPITIKSIVKGGAIINGQNSATFLYGIYMTANYNILNGFQITGNKKTGLMMFSSSNNQIINNEIHGNGTGFVVAGDAGNGIYQDNASNGNYFGNNYVHNNLEHGIYDDGSNTLIFNNILANNGRFGWMSNGEFGAPLNRKIYNNTFIGNGRSAVGFYKAIYGVEVKNNIFYKQGFGAISILALPAGSGGIVIDNNISFGNATGDWWTDGSLAVTATNWKHNDPLFVDAAAADYHVLSSSPAIDTGVSTAPTVTTDFDGNARPHGSAIDIGAFESIY